METSKPKYVSLHEIFKKPYIGDLIERGSDGKIDAKATLAARKKLVLERGHWEGEKPGEDYAKKLGQNWGEDKAKTLLEAFKRDFPALHSREQPNFEGFNLEYDSTFFQNDDYYDGREVEAWYDDEFHVYFKNPKEKKIYRLSPKDPLDNVGSCTSMIVCASWNQDAILMHPFPRDNSEWEQDNWAKSPSEVVVLFLGKAAEHIDLGVVTKEVVTASVP